MSYNDEEKDKCSKCGNPGKGFHICVDLSYIHPQEAKFLAKKQLENKKTEENRQRSATGLSRNHLGVSPFN